MPNSPLPTPEAKRAVEMIMREFHHASSFVMEQHVQQALDAITDKALTLFGKSLAEKDKVIEGLRSALSSNLCSEHQTPDPLNCDTCNKVTSLTGANLERMAMIDRLQAQLEEAQQATADLHKEFISVVKERDEARGEIDEWTQATTRERSQRINYGTRIDMLTEELTQAEKARDELVGLVKAAACPNKCVDGVIIHMTDPDDQQQCQWCDERTTLLARIDAKGEK